MKTIEDKLFEDAGTDILAGDTGERHVARMIDRGLTAYGLVRSIYEEENTLQSENDKTELAVIDYAVDGTLYESSKDRLLFELNCALKNNTGNDQRGYFMRAYLGPAINTEPDPEKDPVWVADENNIIMVWAGESGSIPSGSGVRTFDINLSLQRRGDTQVRMRGISQIGPLESALQVTGNGIRAAFSNGTGFGNLWGGIMGGFASDAYNADFSTTFWFRVTLQNSHIDPQQFWLRDRLQIIKQG